MIAIIDYGVGNLFSLQSSFAAIGAEAVITSDPGVIRKAGRLLLPGVGAFGDAADKLKATGMDEVLRQEKAAGKPILGICLGMQLLFDKSTEYGNHQGLGFIPGTIRPIADVVPEGLKIPHMGWNPLIFKGDKHPLFRYIKEGDCVYFVHSYQATECREHTIAVSEYGGTITAAVARENVMGCQFHPEKSGEVGLNILRAFCEKEEKIC